MIAKTKLGNLLEKLQKEPTCINSLLYNSYSEEETVLFKHYQLSIMMYKFMYIFMKIEDNFFFIKDLSMYM